VTLAPLLAAPAVVQVHAAAAVLALTIGASVLLLRKGTLAHKRLGATWALLMLVTAATSFAITSIIPGHFSPIHILSIVTLVAIPYAIWQRRRGNIKAHATAMILTFAGLFIAGIFTLVPGRLMHKVFFGS
jgi:uncharacterized membrane protein